MNGDVEVAGAGVELARRIRDGDRDAEAELADRFRHPVFVMCVARTHDPDLSRDLAQEIFLNVLRALRNGNLRDEACLTAFIHGTTRNLINAHFRAVSRQRNRPVPADDPPAVNPESEYERQERLASVRQALEMLTSGDREILLLTLVDGLKPGEIAERLELGSEVVRKRKSRALQRIREAIEELSRS